jgi:hypothetical protein
MDNLHDWLISITSAIIGGFFSYLIACKHRRTAEDAVREDILIKSNDEIRRKFREVAENYTPYRIRVTLSNGTELLVRNIRDVNESTINIDYNTVLPSREDFMASGSALLRFSAIAMIDNDSKNRHRERADNSR